MKAKARFLGNLCMAGAIAAAILATLAMYVSHNIVLWAVNGGLFVICGWLALKNYRMAERLPD